MILNRIILMSDIEFRALKSNVMSSYHQAVRNSEWSKARECRDSFNELLAQYWAMALTH